MKDLLFVLLAPYIFYVVILTCIHCENVAECDVNECENNATCFDYENQTQFCVCPMVDVEGFSEGIQLYNGSLCENDYNECENIENFCLNNGTCINRIGQLAECQCLEEYSGLRCEIVQMTNDSLADSNTTTQKIALSNSNRTPWLVAISIMVILAVIISVAFYHHKYFVQHGHSWRNRANSIAVLYQIPSRLLSFIYARDYHTDLNTADQVGGIDNLGGSGNTTVESATANREKQYESIDDRNVIV